MIADYSSKVLWALLGLSFAVICSALFRGFSDGFDAGAEDLLGQVGAASSVFSSAAVVWLSLMDDALPEPLRKVGLVIVVVFILQGAGMYSCEIEGQAESYAELGGGLYGVISMLCASLYSGLVEMGHQ